MNRREERGQAMVEFTLIASVLGVLLLTVFQFGVVFSNYINVADAARAAARKASTSGATSTYVAATEASGRQYAIDSSNDAATRAAARRTTGAPPSTRRAPGSPATRWSRPSPRRTRSRSSASASRPGRSGTR
jgi:Flp pilus assembly protein TadG